MASPSPWAGFHHDPVNAPRSGGHWSLVVGWDPATRQVTMHDPYGEANLVGGGYVSTSFGSVLGQRYSERDWGRCWMVEGVVIGWWLELAI